MDGPRLTSLLPNRVLNRLERMRINATRRFTNRSRGENLSGRGGNSIEFSDYRDYSPGDDVRFVDWNIFARLNRPYLKLYRQEEEMHVVVLVDASASMGFEGKLDQAQRLGAAFGMMGLLGTERVSAYAFNAAGDGPGFLPRCRGRASLPKFFGFLEEIRAGGDAPIDRAVETMLKRHVGRGVAVLLSDFLTLGDMRRAFNRLFSAGLEIFAVQVLSPAEIDPEVGGDQRLVDCESEAVLDVSASGELLALYHEYRERYARQLGTLCRQRGGRFVTVGADAAVEQVLFDLLLRQGWLA
jgi:uncharacterized protein (DUF58 family)